MMTSARGGSRQRRLSDIPAFPSCLREWAVEGAANAFVIVDLNAPDQPVVDVNAAFERVTGYSKDEVLQRNCRFLQGPGTDPAAVAQMREAIAARAETTVVLRNYRKDGSPFWNELYLSPIAAANGVVTHYVGVQTDVSARVRATELEVALAAEKQSSRLKDVFLATVSHELRTPLTAIAGYAELLGLGQLPPEQADDVAHLRRSAAHLLGLIDDVLLLTSLAAGREVLSQRPVAVRELVTSVIAAEGSAAEAKGLSLEATVPATLTAWSDTAVLRRVLRILIGNAVKFTNAGWVRTTARETAAGVEVVVEDSGPGIAPERLSQLFTSFQHREDGLARKHGGAGLGLAIARQLLDLHGGLLQVESRVGHGSRVTILLPGVPATRHQITGRDEPALREKAGAISRQQRQPRDVSAECRIKGMPTTNP